MGMGGSNLASFLVLSPRRPSSLRHVHRSNWGNPSLNFCDGDGLQVYSDGWWWWRHTWYLSFLIHHHIFRLLKNTTNIVGKVQKIALQKNSVNQHLKYKFTYLVFCLAHLVIWLAHLLFCLEYLVFVWCTWCFVWRPKFLLTEKIWQSKLIGGRGISLVWIFSEKKFF